MKMNETRIKLKNIQDAKIDQSNDVMNVSETKTEKLQYQNAN